MSAIEGVIAAVLISYAFTMLHKILHKLDTISEKLDKR
jgi:Flp pilus assembly pilin Flp